jgi:hypothetical protein
MHFEIEAVYDLIERDIPQAVLLSFDRNQIARSIEILV